MGQYVLRRTLYALVVMWAVATLVFFMLRAVPGDPVRAMLGFEADPQAAAAIRHQLGLDRPLYVQYVLWFRRLFEGELGQSIWNGQPVTRLLVETFPRTLSLAGLGFLIAVLLGLPAGLVSAVRKNSALDYGVSLLAFLGLSMPDFWLGVLLIMLFSVHLRWLPAIGYIPLAEGFWPWLAHLILPAISVGTAFSAILARMIRSSLLEVLKLNYITTARAKGLEPSRVVFRHALKNALIPVVTVMGIAFALLMAGAVVVENVFAIPGLGRVLIRGILNRDYPVVQGAVLLVSAIFVFTNLLVDVLYAYINPRIRYEG